MDEPLDAIVIPRALLDEIGSLPDVESVRVVIEVLVSDIDGPVRHDVDPDWANDWISQMRAEAAAAAAQATANKNRAAWERAIRAEITVTLDREEPPLYRATHSGGDVFVGETEEAAIREVLDHMWSHRRRAPTGES